MKGFLLTTPVGIAALKVRDFWEIVWSAATASESAGTIANDIIASRLLPRLCGDGGVFLDVGSHIGSTIAAVHKAAPSARIIAFEAITEKARRLESRFPFAEVMNLALGDKEGMVDFFVDTKFSGYSGLSDPSIRTGSPVKTVSVRCRKLDRVVENMDVGVIKIDVEGAEPAVLRGAEETLIRCRPIVLFESGPFPDAEAIRDKESLFHQLQRLNYGVFVPNRVRHLGPELTREGFLESHYYPRRTTNFFALPLEKREQVRLKLLADGRRN